EMISLPWSSPTSARELITINEAARVVNLPAGVPWQHYKSQWCPTFHFSVSQWILCASVVKFLLRQFHHRDTEGAQRPREQLKSGHYQSVLVLECYEGGQ